MRRGTMLDLVHTNKEGLVGNMKIKGGLGCNAHEMAEFKILRQQAGCTASSLSWTSGDQTSFCLLEVDLATVTIKWLSSGSCMEKSG